MKRFLLSVCLCLGLCAGGREQVASGDAISYQAIARDASGQIIAEHPIGVKVEILQGTTEGAAVYSETHEATTSSTGVVNLSIGNGTEPSGSFSDIDWGASTYFLKLSMDTKGGKDYLPISTTQIMPVPVALYAKEAGNVRGSESFAMPRFVIGGALNGDSLFENLDGVNAYIDNETGKYSMRIFFTISYLDGIDQQLNATLEGAGDCSIDDSESSASTPIGRTIRMTCYFTDKVETANLVIKDKDGNSLQSFPFKIIYNEN